LVPCATPDLIIGAAASSKSVPAKPTLGEMDYLLESPDDRAGALGFGLNNVPPAPLRKFNQTLDLAKLQDLADALIKDEIPSDPAAPQALWTA
jgi:serine/threonine-protein kinase HipA